MEVQTLPEELVQSVCCRNSWCTSMTPALGRLKKRLNPGHGVRPFLKKINKNAVCCLGWPIHVPAWGEELMRPHPSLPEKL